MKEIVFDRNTAFTPEGILDVVANSEGISQDELTACSPGIMRLLLALATLILGFLSEKLGFSDDLQEYLDLLEYFAKMNSETSSCPPSTDKPWDKRRNGSDVENANIENDSDPDEDGTDDDQEAWEKEEKESESELRNNKDRSLRDKGMRKKGKQPGSKGYGIHIPKDAERLPTVLIPPEKCANCPKWEDCKASAHPKGQRHNVIDIKMVVTVTPYQTCTVSCPLDHHQVHESEHPEESKGANQYGIHLKSLLVCLRIAGMVCLDRLHKIIGALLDLKLSPATIEKYIHELAMLVRPVMDRILEVLTLENVVNMDETGSRVNGKNRFIFTLSTARYTFLSLQESRSIKAMEAIGFFQRFRGYLVHDCYRAYWHFTNVIHAVCNAHILRELKGLSRFFSGAKEWADDMIRLLQEMCHAKNEAVRRGESNLPEEALNDFSRRYDALIKRGMEIHPERRYKNTEKRMKKQGRARNLLERMELRKEEIFRFLYVFDVPFTNNIAEGSFRLVSKFSRCIGTFRSFASAQDCILVWAYLDTARKHGYSYYEAVYAAFEGRAMELIFPEPSKDTTQKEKIA